MTPPAEFATPHRDLILAPLYDDDIGVNIDLSWLGIN
ncbi:hypothetical protein FHT40_005203 [Mycolicibacterium sp. BK556]|nr:hypothetical protein [Mycolicibacterium sp. BK556]MBB3635987.1 hypothetical protein [Mycolicibacterium sp. BK607]